MNRQGSYPISSHDRYKLGMSYAMLFIGIAGIFFVVVMIMVIAIVTAVQHDTLERLALFGDAFNMLTAIFSVLAFFGLIVQITYAIRQFGLQQKEARLQFARQQLEGHLFQLIKNWRDELNELEISVKGPLRPSASSTQLESELRIVKGQSALREFLKRFKAKYQSYLASRKYDSPVDAFFLGLRIGTKYELAVNESDIDAGHYFRMLYHIMKLIDDSDVLSEDTARRKSLVGMIRSHLSQTEFSLLLYNGISRYGSNKMKDLIDKYDLIQNMEVESIINLGDIYFYPKTLRRWLGSGKLVGSDIDLLAKQLIISEKEIYELRGIVLARQMRFGLQFTDLASD